MDYKKILLNPIFWQVLIIVSIGYIIIRTLKKGGNIVSGILPEKINFPSSTLDLNQIKNIADNLHMYMFDIGTDFDSMWFELKDLNKEELKEVYNQFGRRAYIGMGRAFGIGAGLDLFGWFKKELDDNELEKMRIIWKKTGLPITF